MTVLAVLVYCPLLFGASAFAGRGNLGTHYRHALIIPVILSKKLLAIALGTQLIWNERRNGMYRVRVNLERILWVSVFSLDCQKLAQPSSVTQPRRMP